MSSNLGFTDSFLFLCLQGRSDSLNIYNVNKRQFEATMKTFYDSSENIVDGIAAVWSITDCTFANEITQTGMDLCLLQAQK